MNARCCEGSTGSSTARCTCQDAGSMKGINSKLQAAGLGCFRAHVRAAGRVGSFAVVISEVVISVNGCGLAS